MILDVLEYIQGSINDIVPTFIHTPENNPANQNKLWAVIQAPVVGEINTDLCNNKIVTETIEISVVDSELHSYDNLREVTSKISEYLQNVRPVSYNNTRIYEIKNVYVNTGLYGLANKEHWIVSADVMYG